MFQGSGEAPFLVACGPPATNFLEKAGGGVFVTKTTHFF